MSDLLLIPCPIAAQPPHQCLPAQVLQVIKDTKVFMVEDLRSARRFISSTKQGIVIDELEFFVLNKKTKFEAIYDFMCLHAKADIGVISEAGCPAVADPGSLAVAVAHQTQRKVVPLVGPSSILLTLMASGFNGQSFVFHGYLPINQKERAGKIKQMEKEAFQKKQTQLFMDTPYRNNHVLETILKTCSPQTLLCIAAELTSEQEFVKTYSIEKWKKEKLDLHKKPVIFALYF